MDLNEYDFKMSCNVSNEMDQTDGLPFIDDNKHNDSDAEFIDTDFQSRQILLQERILKEILNKNSVEATSQIRPNCTPSSTITSIHNDKADTKLDNYDSSEENSCESLVIVPSRTTAPEIIDISSDESEGEMPIECQMQQEKVGNFRRDMLKAKNILITIGLDIFPDGGKLICAKHQELRQLLKEEEQVLRIMLESHKESIGKPSRFDDISDVGDSSSDYSWQNISSSDNSVAELFTPNRKVMPSTSWADLESELNKVKPRNSGNKALQKLDHQKALTMNCLQQLHNSLATRPEEHQMASDPSGLKVELMSHQKHAIAWMLWREQQKPNGGLLADDMGVGKTLTMLALIVKSKETEEQDENNDSTEIRTVEGKEERKTYKYKGGTLVICPASLISQWDGECRSKLNRRLLSVQIYHGPKRDSDDRKLAAHDMVITTYSIVMHEFGKNSPIYNIKWRRIIMDEAHQVRNFKSQTSKAVCRIAGTSRWALTGTPIHNKELDLYALLKFLQCSPFDDLAVWKRWVARKGAGGQNRLNTVISSILLRRTKVQLMENGTLTCLPTRNWELIEIKMDKDEMFVYQKVLIFSRTLFAQYLHQRAEKRGEPEYGYKHDPNNRYFKLHQKLLRETEVDDVQSHEILVLLLRLRQVCCHLSLILGMLTGENDSDNSEGEGHQQLNLFERINQLESETKNDLDSEEYLKEGVELASKHILKPSDPIFAADRLSTKIAAVLQVLREKVLPENDKAIIVSQWTGMLRLIAMHLKQEGIQFEQLDGTVPVNKRTGMVENLNNPLHSTRILMLSLTAGGVGLNLIGANHLLLVDLHWNPQLESQAQDRIYRVGQVKPVHVYKFVTTDTIEERIKGLQEQKLAIADSLLTGAKIARSSKLSLNDLKHLFGM